MYFQLSFIFVYKYFNIQLKTIPIILSQSLEVVALTYAILLLDEY